METEPNWSVCVKGEQRDGVYSRDAIIGLAGYPHDVLLWQPGQADWTAPAETPGFSRDVAPVEDEPLDEPAGLLGGPPDWIWAGAGVLLFIAGALIAYYTHDPNRAPELQPGLPSPVALPAVESASPAPPLESPAPQTAPQPPREPVPHITSLDPPAVKPGDMVIIYGTGFSTNIKHNIVRMDDYQMLGGNVSVFRRVTGKLRMLSCATNEIRFLVPTDANTTTLSVRVGRYKSNSMPLTVMRPHIARMMPVSAVPGQKLTVQLQGTYTHFDKSQTTFHLDAPSVKVISYDVISPTRIQASLDIHPYSPLGLKSVTVTTGSEKARYAPGFRIEMRDAPVIARVEVLSPGWVPTLDGTSRHKISHPMIRIHGQHFRPNLVENRVKVNGRGCVLHDASTEAIDFGLPSDIKEGELSVTVDRRESNSVHVRVP